MKVQETDTIEQRFSTRKVVVHVLDVNDNRPTVPETMMEFDVLEGDYSAGRLIVNVSYMKFFVLYHSSGI